MTCTHHACDFSPLVARLLKCLVRLPSDSLVADVEVALIYNIVIRHGFPEDPVRGVGLR